jgi:hypothetical protein
LETFFIVEDLRAHSTLSFQDHFLPDLRRNVEGDNSKKSTSATPFGRRSARRADPSERREAGG